MICLSTISPHIMQNDEEVVASSPFLNPTTMKGSGESMDNANSSKLSLEERKAKKAEYQLKYYAANKSKTAKYLEANKLKIADQKSKYRKKHKLQASESQRKYRESNKEKIARYNAKYKKERLKTDTLYRFTVRLRQRQARFLKAKCKIGSSVRDIGCTGQEACEHIESLFDKNMTWDNWGSYWHLDHIFPLAAANLEDRAEYLAVSNWRNLQPLEAKANIAKGDKVTPAARRLFNKLVKEFS